MEMKPRANARVRRPPREQLVGPGPKLDNLDLWVWVIGFIGMFIWAQPCSGRAPEPPHANGEQQLPASQVSLEGNTKSSTNRAVSGDGEPKSTVVPEGDDARSVAPPDAAPCDACSMPR